MKKKILISTGGSGGHVLPAINILEHLKEKYETFLATDIRGLKYFNNNAYKYFLLNTPKSKSIYLIPFNIFIFTICIIKSFLYLKKNKIDYILSTGGYMSLPICISARMIGIDIYLYEPNMVVGRANKYFLNSCKKIICTSNKLSNFPDVYKDKIYLIDPILKKEIYTLEKKKSIIPVKSIDLLVLGGSQGAKFLDELITQVVLKLSKNFKISLVQQVYENRKILKLKKIYKDANINSEIFSYEPNIYNKMANCNLAITRCGASTLAELVQLNVPFIGVPFPHAKDNHQYLNVKNYFNNNCCWLVEQKNINLDKMVDLIEEIFKDENKYKKKIINMNNISCKNNWNNVNKKLIDLFNEY